MHVTGKQLHTFKTMKETTFDGPKILHGRKIPSSSSSLQHILANNSLTTLNINLQKPHTTQFNCEIMIETSAGGSRKLPQAVDTRNRNVHGHGNRGRATARSDVGEYGFLRKSYTVWFEGGGSTHKRDTVTQVRIASATMIENTTTDR